MCFVFKEKFVYLEDLFLKPEVRGKGIGRKLFEAVAKVTRVKGFYDRLGLDFVDFCFSEWRHFPSHVFLLFELERKRTEVLQ